MRSEIVEVREKWDIVPHYKKNFVCELVNTGVWRLEKPCVNGKWIFLVRPIGNNTAPTFGDQRNFFTGLFEAEWINDNYIFKDGETRNAQRHKKIDMFKDVLDKIKNRADIKDMDKGISYYIEKFQGGQ